MSAVTIAKMLSNGSSFMCFSVSLLKILRHNLAHYKSWIQKKLVAHHSISNVKPFCCYTEMNVLNRNLSSGEISYEYCVATWPNSNLCLLFIMLNVDNICSKMSVQSYNVHSSRMYKNEVTDYFIMKQLPFSSFSFTLFRARKKWMKKQCRITKFLRNFNI